MAIAELLDDEIVISTEWAEKDLVKIVPGTRWEPDDKAWRAPLTWATCVTLRGVFGPDLQVGSLLRDWAWADYRDRVQPVQAIRERMDNGLEFIDQNNDHDDLLYPFQMVGREFLAIAGDALLGDDMGTGKSVQALAAMRLVQRRTGDAFPALIVCPNSVKRHWERHVRDWLPEATPYVVGGTPTVKRKTLARALEDPTAVVIVNVEAMRLHSRLAGFGDIALKRCRECDPRRGDSNLKASSCEVHPRELNGFGFRTCVLDEAHRAQSPRAQQTRALWATFHDPSVRRRWGLTGTVISNHPGDLWPVMHVLAPREYPTKSKYENRYALTSFNAFGAMEITGLNPQTRDEFFLYFDPRFRRMTKDLVLPQLPSKVRYLYEVEMTPKQRKAYDEMADRLVTRLEDGSLLVSRSSLTAQIRLLQLAGSYCEVETITCRVCLGHGAHPVTGQRCLRCAGTGLETLVTPTEPSPKLDAMMQILEDAGAIVVRRSEGGQRQEITPGPTPVVVAAEHRKLLELASARLEKHGIPHVMVTGAVPEATRGDGLARFQAGQVNLVLFTFKAGGVGLNMARAGKMIRLQRSWSLIDNKQGEDRVHRIGSEVHDQVELIDVITRDTVEEDQVHRLHVKLGRLEEINRDRRRRLDAGVSVEELDQEESRLMNAYLGVPDDGAPDVDPEPPPSERDVVTALDVLAGGA